MTAAAAPKRSDLPLERCRSVNRSAILNRATQRADLLSPPSAQIWRGASRRPARPSVRIRCHRRDGREAGPHRSRRLVLLDAADGLGPDTTLRTALVPRLGDRPLRAAVNACRGVRASCEAVAAEGPPHAAFADHEYAWGRHQERPGSADAHAARSAAMRVAGLTERREAHATSPRGSHRPSSRTACRS